MLGFFYVFSLDSLSSRFWRVPGALRRCQNVLLPSKILPDTKVSPRLCVSPRNFGLNVFEKSLLLDFSDEEDVLRCRGEYNSENVGKILLVKTGFLTNSPMIQRFSKIIRFF